jgi:hypothetical protein
MENTEAPESQPEAASKERFFRYFQQQVTALQEQIERIKTTAFSGSERNDAIDDCLAGIDRLSHEAKDASSYIPAYDQRTYGEVCLCPSKSSLGTTDKDRRSRLWARNSRKRAPRSHRPRNSSSAALGKITPPVPPLALLRSPVSNKCKHRPRHLVQVMLRLRSRLAKRRGRKKPLPKRKQTG